MTVVDAVAFCGAVIAVGIPLPQFLLVVRTRDTHGLSIVMWVLSLGTVASWLSHGIRLDVVNMVWPNVLSLAMTTTILFMLYRQGKYHWYATWLPGLALGALLIGLDYGVGTACYGIAVVIPQAYGMVRQGIALIRAERVSGVSIPSWIFQVVNQLVWLIWAVMAHETGTFISAVVSLVAALFVLLWRILRACGLGPIGGRHLSVSRKQ